MNIKLSIFLQSLVRPFLVICIFSGFFLVLHKLYIPRLAAFGCFDNCFNYGAGYFITQGKLLYRDIFFNHQPMMPYLTAGIQQLTHPINIYELLLRHRQVVMLIALVFNVCLVLRFGLPAIGFAATYELTKWYLFGDRFLAEGIIVYPLVYITGLVWEKLHHRIVKQQELYIASVLTWFIVFSREPFIPVTLCLFFLLLWLSKKIIPALLFLILTGATLIMLPLSDYIYNVATVNSITVIADSLRQTSMGERLIRMAFYPLLILTSSPGQIFWQYLQFVSLLFCISILYLVSVRRSWTWVVILIVLFLANIRAVPVQTVFYQGFQLLPWYGLFLFFSFVLIREIAYKRKITGIILGSLHIILFVWYLNQPSVFFREHISPHEELITNYSAEIQIGNVIAALAHQDDTIFLDGWAELIFWQAKKRSPYPYAWYTAVMPLIPRYQTARITMFQTRPPDIYYGTCPKEKNNDRMLPEQILPLYTRLTSQGDPTCLWVKTTKLQGITKDQWAKANELLFDTP